MHIEEQPEVVPLVQGKEVKGREELAGRLGT